MLKALLKSPFHWLGLDVVRMSRRYMYNLLELRLMPVRTVIDVGANRGQFARNIVDVFPEARLYCFEPVIAAYRELERWARRQEPGRIWTFNFALGEIEHEFEMHVFPEFDQASSFLRPTEHYRSSQFARVESIVRVPVRRLDDLDLTLVPDVLVKLDAQGYDDRVIRGGRHVLQQAAACLIEVELDPMYEGQCTFLAIDNLLAELGYVYRGNVGQAHARDGHATWVEVLFVRASRTGP